MYVSICFESDKFFLFLTCFAYVKKKKRKGEKKREKKEVMSSSSNVYMN